MFKRIWRQLCSDWLRVVMALVLAYMVYALRSENNDKAIQKFENIKINFEYSPDVFNWIKTDHYTSVTLEGNPKVLNNVNSSDININVKIDKKYHLKNEIEITAKNIKCPSKLRVKEIGTPKITVNLELIDYKKVPVIAKFDHETKLKKDYSVSKTEVTPAEITIWGPQSKIKNIKEVFTSDIPLDETVERSFKYKADVVRIDDVTIGQDKVDCDVSISRNFSRRTLNVPVRVLFDSSKRSDFNYKLNPAVAEIEIKGTSGFVQFVSAEDFSVFVNAQHIDKPGEYILPLRYASHLDHIEINSVTPSKLTVQVK